MKLNWIFAALLGLAAAALAHADVQVNFVEPDKFSDIKDNTGFNQPSVLKDLEAHLRKQAAAYLPGRDVVFDVSDVDLAGEVEPMGGQWLRIMREVTPPAMVFKYRVSEQGRVVRQGEVRLRDLAYRDGFNRYPDSDPLRYERRMIDQWFEREFGPAPKAAPSDQR